MNEEQATMEAEKRIDHGSYSAVEDFPDDLDWDKWGGNAICFCLENSSVIKIYALNPNDLSCYHLADYTFPDSDLYTVPFGPHSLIASCTLIRSSLYLIARPDSKQPFSTQLWTWDVSQAQKTKLRGDSYKWKLGPPLNSAKEKALAFSLGGNLYALDISRKFLPALEMKWNSSKVRKRNPHDFECLKTSLNSGYDLPRWVTLPPLKANTYSCLCFIGYCCVGDSRFILHMVNWTDMSSFDNHFFCFDVTTKEWSHHCFSGLPLTPEVSDPYRGCLKRICRHYIAQVQNHGLFVHPLTGKIAVFDFSAVFDLIKKPDVYRNPSYSYPYFSLDLDQSHVLKYFEDIMARDIKMWQTFHLGDERFFFLAMYLDENKDLYAWTCTLALEQKRSVQLWGKKKNNTKTFSASKDAVKKWKLGQSLYILPQ